jgi:hypothetical protein
MQIGVPCNQVSVGSVDLAEVDVHRACRRRLVFPQPRIGRRPRRLNARVVAGRRRAGRHRRCERAHDRPDPVKTRSRDGIDLEPTPNRLPPNDLGGLETSTDEAHREAPAIAVCDP